ncbi:MAG: ABC transporter permease [Clostridia bacterium]
MQMSSLINALPGAVAQGLIWGIMAIGVFITYKVLDLADLTVDGTMCTGGAVCCMMTIAGYPMWLSMICAFFAGTLAGLATAILHTKLGIPAILAGILTQLSLYSINLRILDDSANKALSVDKYDLLVSLRYINNAMLVTGVILFVLICVLYWFFGTELGASIRSTGANPNMSRAQGVNTDLTKILGLMLSNGLVAVSSALLTQYNGFADVNMGRGAIVIGLAAVIIGEAIFGKISENFAFKLAYVAVGAVIYYIVVQTVVSLKLMSTNDMKLLSAMIVALFLSVPYLKNKYMPKKKTRVKGGAA